MPAGRPPSAHLLRALAAVAPGSRVVDAACGEGRHLEALALLGFDVWAAAAGDPGPARRQLAAAIQESDAQQRVVQADPDALGYPDAWADWVVLADVARDTLAGALAEVGRVLRPGGWVWVEVAPGEEGALADAARAVGLVLAEPPAAEDGRIHAIYRRPGDVG